jgi:hypothetical protein
MKNVFVRSARREALALHVSHRDSVTRAPWRGPAAPAGNGNETTRALPALY